MNNDYPEKFHCSVGGLQRMRDIIVVNTLPVTLLSAFVLGQMESRGKGGVVINVSSISAYFPIFYLAVYSASKVQFLYFVAFNNG